MPDLYTAPKTAATAGAAAQSGRTPDYSRSPAGLPDHVTAFAVGFAGMFLVLFTFYKIIPLCIAGGVVFGVIYIFVSAQTLIKKRRMKLRTQFYDLLEAMSVAMRAGNNEVKALQSAREDLILLYPSGSDIITEIDIIIAMFYNSVPLAESFSDFARRSEIEDIASFASIYRTIEGKSSRSDQIVRQTQQIIADKMEIEMEIDTLMTAAKSEVNIMIFMPLVILTIIGNAGAGFMDSIYTTAMGRVVSTFGFVVFIVSFILARKFSSVSL